MCDPSTVKCPCVTSFEQLERLLNAKQEEDKPLTEHTQKFKQEQDNVKSIMGTKWLDKFAENTEECTSNTKDDIKETLKKTSCESFVAHTFLRNCDNPKCGGFGEKIPITMCIK